MTTSEMRRQSSRVVVEGRGVIMWCGLNFELESGGAGVEVVILGDEDGSEVVAGVDEVTEGRFENSTMARKSILTRVVSWSEESLQSMSTLRTLAPSLANKAASGLPTTSDLNISYLNLTYRVESYLLITVITFPLALSPYSSILLYTPRCSRTLTIAKGVHGRMDLTVPDGAESPSDGDGLRG